jgi:hypothetical protein
VTTQERDNYVLTRLAAVAPLTGVQAANSVIHTAGRNFLRLSGMDPFSALDADVAGLQAAVTALTDPSLRASVTATLNSTYGAPTTGARNVQYPCPAGMASTLWYQLRTVAAGG